MNLSVVHTVNNTLESNEKYPSINTYILLSFICACLMIPVAIFGIAGNGFTIYIFTKRSKKTSINFLVSALSGIDIVLLAVGTSVFAASPIHSYYRSSQLLFIVRYLIVSMYPIALMAQTASVWTMIVITFERYVAVCRPFRAMYLCKRRHAIFALILIVISAVCYNIVRFWEYRFYPEENRLVDLLKSNELYLRVYSHWMYFILIFLMPFLIMLIFQTLIIVAIRNARESRLQLSRQEWSEHRTAIMMVVIMFVFLTCNLLALILNSVEAVDDDTIENYSDVFILLTDLSNLLVEVNSSVNFFVYYCFSQTFRLAVNRAITSIKNSKSKSKRHLSTSNFSSRALSLNVTRFNSMPEENILLQPSFKRLRPVRSFKI